MLDNMTDMHGKLAHDRSYTITSQAFHISAALAYIFLANVLASSGEPPFWSIRHSARLKAMVVKAPRVMDDLRFRISEKTSLMVMSRAACFPPEKEWERQA